MSNTKIIINLSNTALGTMSCILKFHRTVIDGYKTLPSAKIVYGVAIHKFIDHMYKSGGEDVAGAILACRKAFNIPKIEETKSRHINEERHLHTVCNYVWHEYIANDSNFDVLSIDGKPATEISFSFQYYEDDYIIVNLAGTLDSIGQFRKGCFAIRDWKTTSWSYSPDSYFRKYELSRQLRFYRLVCKLLSEKEPESTIGRIGATDMRVFIDAVFIKPNPNDIKVVRSEVFSISTTELIAFQLQIDDQIQKISKAIRTGFLPKEGIITGACDAFGGCAFFDVCKNGDEIGKILLSRDFKQVTFNPLQYDAE